MHRAIETSGYCQPEIFREILNDLDYIVMDIKLADEAQHRHYTGVSNRIILENLDQLKASGKPFRIRIPVIPGVNDSRENFEQTASLLEDSTHLELVELLPYHKTAGAKYEMVDLEYRPEFDIDQKPVLDPEPFLRRGITCRSI